MASPMSQPRLHLVGTQPRVLLPCPIHKISIINDYFLKEESTTIGKLFSGLAVHLYLTAIKTLLILQLTLLVDMT